MYFSNVYQKLFILTPPHMLFMPTKLHENGVMGKWVSKGGGTVMVSTPHGHDG
jgi:hypothetical protein